MFANAVQAPTGLAPDAARAALAYGVNEGLSADGQQALQLQYAIWQALGETSSPKGDATAQDVVTNGTAAPASPQGTSLLDAATAGQVSVTLFPSVNPAQQTMAGYATDVQVNNPQRAAQPAAQQLPNTSGSSGAALLWFSFAMLASGMTLRLSQRRSK